MSTAVYQNSQHINQAIALGLTKIALGYLSIPVFIFLFHWLNLGAALFFSAILLFGLSQTWALKESQPQMSVFDMISYLFRNNWCVLSLFFLWMLLSGTGGIGFQNTDYAASNALLKDLIDSSWPLYLRDKVPVVYYFFYYLPAAYIGKWLGWEAANIFIFAWTYFGLSITWIALSLAIGLNNPSILKQVTAAAIFILFGGWDFLGALTINNPNYLQPGAHIEWWAGLGQFSSHTTLLFWVPQHAIAPWLTTSFILLAFLHNMNKTAIPLLASLSFLWSPIASLGLLPFLVVLILFDKSKHDWASLSGISSILIAPFIAMLGFLFYSSNSFRFPLEWQISKTGFISNYLIFIFLECVPLGIPFFFQHFKQKIFLTELSLPPPLKLSSQEKAIGWIALSTLLLLPLYKLGIMNDLCMRASIPALLVLSTFFLKVLRREFTFQYTQYAAVTICFLLGAGSAVNEITRSFQYYSSHIPPREHVASLLNSPENSVIEQRAGDSSSFFWHWLGPIQHKHIYSPATNTQRE